MKRFLLIAIISLIAGSAGYLFSREQHASPASQPLAASAQSSVNTLMDTQFATSTGQWQKLAAWKGKVLVVNYWATWCPPCREEMPMFSTLHKKYQTNGVQFVGIGIDSVDKIREYQISEKIAYPLLIGTLDAMRSSQALGNTAQALPFTVLINRQGQLDAVKLGKFTEAELEARLQFLIKQ
ncbi:MAG: TlpA disulfide reductase family protein [Rugosibacter sp.]